MDLRGEGGGGSFIHGGDDVVGHQDHVRPSVDPRLEGEKVGGQEGVVGAVVIGHAGVGVGVVPVAWEVLEHAAHALLRHGFHHRRDVLGGLLGVPAQSPVIDEVRRVLGDVAHRGEIDVDAQTFQEPAFLLGVAAHQLQSPLAVQGLGGAEGGGAQVGIAAHPVDGATLLVHGDQQGNLGGVLAALDVCGHLFRRLVLEVPAEEDVAPQMVVRRQLGGVGLRAPGDEHLPHLLLQGHAVQELLGPGGNGVWLFRLLSGGVGPLRFLRGSSGFSGGPGLLRGVRSFLVRRGCLSTGRKLACGGTPDLEGPGAQGDEEDRPQHGSPGKAAFLFHSHDMSASRGGGAHRPAGFLWMSAV